MVSKPTRFVDISTPQETDEDPEDDASIATGKGNSSTRISALPSEIASRKRKIAGTPLDDGLTEDRPHGKSARKSAPTLQKIRLSLGKPARGAEAEAKEEDKKAPVALSARARQRLQAGKSVNWFKPEWWKEDCGLPPRLKAALIDSVWPEESTNWKAWAATEPVRFRFVIFLLQSTRSQ